MDVTVSLSGTLAARTGVHRARVGVEKGATVADAVDALAARHGPAVRAGLLDGGRLRTELVAAREGPAGVEALATDSRLRHGDEVSVWLADGSVDAVEQVEGVDRSQDVAGSAAVEHQFVG